MQIPILFEDNHLLVVVKPPGMPTQEDDSGDPDLLNALKTDLKVRHAKPGNVFLGLVHRLDRPVGGVMVFARTSKAASRLSDQVRRQKLDKTYLAVAGGIPVQREARLRDYLLKDAQTNTVSVVSPQTSGAKEALLDYALIESRDVFSLLQIRLLTGRSHQIRVQLATAGHPLYADLKYGGQRGSKPNEPIALWAHALSFEHPTQKEPLTFTSYPPRTYPWQLFESIERSH